MRVSCKDMTKEQIKKKYKGMYGIFAHDMFRYSPEEYAQSFISAFNSYKDALRCAVCHGENTAIHII